MANRALILGGVRVQSDFGLAGHTDGDVVLHALIDALSGAAGLPDMAERYPEDLRQLADALGLPVDSLHEHGISWSTDEQNSDATLKKLSSAVMLSQTLADVLAEGWVINNVDLTILAKRPKLTSQKLPIRKSIADLLTIDWNALSVKTCANAGFDLVDQGRAIACEVGLTLKRDVQ